MIKIQIDNIQQRKQEYTDALTDLVAFRVSVFHQSLSHLNGVVVDFTTGHFASFRPVTKNIFEIVGDEVNMPNGRDGYINTINNYLAAPNLLANINIAGLIQFCDDMLANNNQQLSELLVCEAADLMNHSETILNNNGLNTAANIAVIKLAFDYTKYNADISSHIREYFREREFVKFCPYCNTKTAHHNLNVDGEVVDSYELDHFYDKARYPLLSYSLFNLVPSDHTCNVTNKGVTQFTDKYHINPHLSGYIDQIKFVPVGLNPAYDVDRIEMEISEAQGSVLYKKINGNNPPATELGELGNLNVFKIRSKHCGEKHRARTILKTLDTNNSYRKHIKKYLQSLNGLNIKDSYKKWYEKELNVCFNSINFNDKAYSKFSRDIHDHYYSKNRTVMNRYIIELIDEH
ncbi:MAG: hypothetical protein Q8S14_15415 [Algoriphagus sp.]|uniref:hypothetical protein n=1 Tax=Algoriphagus sp. TaxID=1872435 RepID=UPI0027321398|nr:hypothetical protein [Algoriphagus sp.]MDP2042253.1 hypothetical protein [Algoriphagus sp.]MDP3473254.1 hypothetical protein [Algoriphagus sp.]